MGLPGVPMNRRVLAVVALIAALLASPLLARPAEAADVPVTLIAFTTSWHVGTETAPADPTITVTAGDVLRLRVQNHDAFPHTFTLPHFSVDLPLSAGSSSNPTVIFVNITTTASDVGTWQFYCAVPGHASGTDPNRTGMVGRVRVNAPAPGVDVTLIAFSTS